MTETKEPNIDKALQTLTDLVRETKEVGAILGQYIERTNAGDQAARAGCLVMASSEAIAKKADDLIDVVDILLLLKKKKREGGE